ncbi:hypothetical protein C7451_10144 [Blastomonas natatoria]|uniref:Uncharacterized protein n=1 Tax=Blastomonas natatoria TaxID=34015 RepID=A0A2V3VAZ5_9SPHN|nr:hypothetical protein [Blastomonas natatoria]PXW78982.1 hypothetical protein C7451_10144 [Blastomonas natatoria]
MPYSDQGVWEHIDAMLDTPDFYVELRITGCPDPLVIKGLSAYDDDGFIVVTADAGNEVAVKASAIVSIRRC